MLRRTLLVVLACSLSALGAPVFTNLNPITLPGNRRSCGGAVRSDGGTDTFLSFGGFNGNTLSDLIQYRVTGNAWVNAGAMQSRERHGLAYDPVHDVFVIVAGATGLTVNDTVFLVNGATLAVSTPPQPTSRPSARLDPLLRWIPAWGKFLYFGGRTSPFANNHVNDLWSLDVGDGGVTWAPVAAANMGPSARGAVCSAVVPETGKVILFGGEGSGPLSDTWSFDPDAGSWAALTVTGSAPGARSFSACAWDPKLGEMVLYGGQITSPTDGLFTFNPMTNVWTSWTVGVNPGTLSDAAAGYSPTLGGVILFAGRSASTTYTQNTWLLTFNRPPTVDAGVDFSAGENVLATLRGEVLDPDADATTVSWRQTAGPAVTLSDAGAPSPSFITPIVFLPTQLRFTLTGADATDSATDEVVVSVLNTINEKPEANAGLDQRVASAMQAELAGSGSDPNGDSIVSFGWDQTAGPAVTLSALNVARPTFVAPTVAVATVLSFELIVSDGSLQSAPDQVFVTVAAAPVDAGVDGGAQDAGGGDAGVEDAGVQDAGVEDAGETDAGETDAGEADAGETDAGETDAGETDAGTSDAGSFIDAGGDDVDAGFSDAGQPPVRSLTVGCGCSEAVSPGWVLLGLAWLARRRREPGD